MKNKRVLIICSIIIILLLIPAIAMQFTTEVNWETSDFMIGALLLFGTGFLIEIILRTVKTTKSRIIICGILLIALALLWAEMAVGLFGTSIAGN